MGNLPTLKPREVAALLQALGFIEVRQRGSHKQFRHSDGRGTSVPYPKGLARLQRLGGAGTWLASTDDIAAMLSAVTDTDRATLEWPGIILDQYGWGHTGSLDGAEACAWVLQDGYTVITAFVSGSKPNTGGKVCDRVVPALAIDLGVYAGDPVRTPD